MGIFPLALGILGVALFYKRSLQSEPLIRLSVFKIVLFRLFLFGFLVCQFLYLESHLSCQTLFK